MISTSVWEINIKILNVWHNPFPSCVLICNLSESKKKKQSYKKKLSIELFSDKFISPTNTKKYINKLNFIYLPTKNLPFSFICVVPKKNYIRNSANARNNTDYSSVIITVIKKFKKIAETTRNLTNKKSFKK